jgi:RNA ligase
MLKVVEYLKTHSIQSLQDFGIYARWSTKNPRKVSLNYDQIEAIDGNEYVNECRGLVLRQDHDFGEGAPGDYSVLARPFPRFYHANSGHAASIDWSTAAFEEKLDGTFCILYWDPDLADWCVATRSIPDADVENANGFTFSELFWKYVDLGYVASLFWDDSDAGRLDRINTYLFELCGPDNQIVVPYDQWEVTLLGVVNNATGEQRRGNAKRFQFKTVAEAAEWLKTQPGSVLEGFVISDARGNRVKLKSENYLAFSRIMTAAGSDMGLLETILSGTADDVREYLPAPRRERLDAFERELRKWLVEVNRFAAELIEKYPNDRKGAALAVQAHPTFSSWIGAFMEIWTGKYPNAHAWLENAKSQASLMKKLTECVKGRL